MKLTIQDLPARPDAVSVAALRGLAVSDVADVVHALTGVAPQATGSLAMRSRPTARLVGVAFTVQLPAGDQLLLQKALDMAQPGDVIVVNTGGPPDRAAVVGEVMSRLARSRGLSGFVIDGCVRDVDHIAEHDWPVYARGVHPGGPTRVGPGVLNDVVWVGGMRVEPGDVLCGDLDGLVCVPAARVNEVPRAVRALLERQQMQIAAIEAGKLDRSWIDDALQACHSGSVRNGE